MKFQILTVIFKMKNTTYVIIKSITFKIVSFKFIIYRKKGRKKRINVRGKGDPSLVVLNVLLYLVLNIIITSLDPHPYILIILFIFIFIFFFLVWKKNI